ncbi:MAG: glycosyltransferase family 2 protein [Oscillospiraceae bacterium]|nr:glycosyltransferase family 2 protein [Oscillospiraceae bacterium]
MIDYTVTGSIVTHNNIDTIETTLRTLKEYVRDVPFRLYIIDNHSKDGTPALAAEAAPWAEHLPLTRNIGFGAGHNLVLEKLDSKYHCIINPDIVLDSDAVTAMARYMDAHEDVTMLSPRIVFPETGGDQILGKRSPTLRYLAASRLRGGPRAKKVLREYAMLDEDPELPFEIENATGCFMFIRTETLQKIGGFDERYFLYFEDCDLTRELGRHGKTLYYPQAVVQHVWNRESKKNIYLALVQLHSMLKYFHKWRRS